MKISICIDAIYGSEHYSKALETIREEGYQTFEFWAWWNKDIDLLIRKKENLCLTAVACCTKMISLCDESKRSLYLEGIVESIAVAKKLGCEILISQVGDDLGLPREEQKASIIAGLKAAAPLLEEAGISLVIEPLNTKIDHKGYFLSSSLEGIEIIKAVDSSKVKLLFDIYHQATMGEDVLEIISEHIKYIGHFHAASVPGRHELDWGTLDYQPIFERIEALGYEGYMGLEYSPSESI